MKLGIFSTVEDFTDPVRKGWDFLEVNVQSFFLPGEAIDAFLKNKELADQARIEIPAACCFLPGSLAVVGPKRNVEGAVKWGETVFQRAEMTGTTRIVFGSGKARSRPEGVSLEEGREQFLEVLGKLAPLAHNHGVTLVIEPLNKAECNLITTLADGAALVNACNHPGVRLLADFFHMAMDNEPASEIEKYGHLIAHTHAAEKEGRTPPGVHGEDLRPYLRALKKVGYDATLSLECKWSDMVKEAPVALDTLKQQLGSL